MNKKLGFGMMRLPLTDKNDKGESAYDRASADEIKTDIKASKSFLEMDKKIKEF